MIGAADYRNPPASRLSGSVMNPFEGLNRMDGEKLFNIPGLQADAVETATTALVPAGMDACSAVHAYE